jgi:protein required for attachment to host cells
MGLASVVDREFVGNNAPTREIGTDKPGRAFESADGSRHAMEPRVDWHRFEKSQFAKRMADILEKAATRQAFDRLVLVAPPQTLGDLRAALGRQARDRLSAELNKDLTQVGIHDLPPYLSAIMRL